MARATMAVMSLTEAAAQRVQTLLAHTTQPVAGVRIGVKPRGCSGLSYAVEYAEAAQPGDEVIADKGVTVFVDPGAVLFLVGSIMDYEDTGTRSGFVFRNPNETGRCGCGESFRVAS